jgi:arsenical resistance operon trans-acting repressor ArsD
MTAIRVFDPAMCCSTGVCGPSVDPQLPRFAADLDWLKAQGVSVERFNLSQQPGAFAEDHAVRSALEANGEAGLPVVKVDGEVRSSGVYPSRGQLAAWAGIAAPAATPLATSGCCAPAANQTSGERSAAKGGGCC